MTVAPATKNVDAYFFGLYSTNKSGNCFFNASINTHVLIGDSVGGPLLC
jgi:hypothetical protein